jgi:hypothetical protein
MEIEPRYADVILKRCEAEGLAVTLATGETSRPAAKPAEEPAEAIPT